MSKTTIKDLEAKFKILENSTESNKIRIVKLEGKQEEVINQRIAVNNIQNQLEILHKSQKETLEKVQLKLRNISKEKSIKVQTKFLGVSNY